MKIKSILVFDWDGVLVDSMPLLRKVALDVLMKHHIITDKDVNPEKIKEQQVLFSGITFDRMLEILFPWVEKEKREQCAKEFYQKIDTEILGEAKTFPGVKNILENFDNRKIPMIISSAYKEEMIKEWLRKEKFDRHISMVFGQERGNKESHIKRIRELFPGKTVVYVSDSPEDMTLGDISIGIAPPELEKQFKKAGAKIVVSSIEHIPVNLEKLG